MEEYLDPLPESRKLILRIKLVAILVGMTLFLGRQHGMDYLESLPICDRVPYWVAALYVMAAVPPLSAAWLFRFGRRSYAAQQMPPPGTFIIYRTRKYHGQQAAFRAKLVMAGSAVILALSVALVVLTTNLVKSLPNCSPNLGTRDLPVGQIGDNSQSQRTGT